MSVKSNLSKLEGHGSRGVWSINPCGTLLPVTFVGVIELREFHRCQERQASGRLFSRL